MVVRARSLSLVIGLIAALFFAGCGDQITVPSGGGAQPAGGTDADFLDAQIEVDGWEILVDRFGFGQTPGRPLALESRFVTSDPTKTDTDDDGLDDLTEWLIRTDPRDPDTDADGLTDFEEWNQYFTSPVSVDSDGDASGPDGDQAPNGFLFDGQELLGTSKGPTSPTHDDTDGDGKSDSEEIDHATRSPVIADFPKIKLEIMGEPVITLRIEYTDGTTIEEGISEEEAESTEVSDTSTSTNTHESHIGASREVMAGAEGKIGGTDSGVTLKAETRIGLDWGTSDTTTREFSKSFTAAASRSTTRTETESNSREETATSGEVMIRVRIRNASDAIAFEVTQIGVAARLWTTPTDPREEPTFKQLAILTLPPGMAGGITLSPGGATGELTFQAEGVNAAVIKEFLRNPAALTFEPIYFDLNNAEGLNFAFLTENTYTQTAMIEIDRGSGEPQVVRVATNIDRSVPDAAGNGGGLFVGITLGRVLEDFLGLVQGENGAGDWEMTLRDGVRVLKRLQGKTENLGPLRRNFVGQARVTMTTGPTDGFEVEILADPAGNFPPVNDGANPAYTGRFEEDWEKAFLGRTFVMTGDDEAYVPVALKNKGNLAADPEQATLILNRPYNGASRSAQYTLNDLFQADPHLTPITGDPLVDADAAPSPETGFWMVLATDGTQVGAGVHFDEIVLKANDQIRLTFWEDKDGDGTSGRTEQYFGTANDCLDCDGDRLGDSVEAIRGWIAGAPAVLPVERERFFEVVDALRADETATRVEIADGRDIEPEEFDRLKAKRILDDANRNYPRWVRSNPKETDSDGDTLDDLAECIAGTDPHQPDTDGDGLRDDVDPSPLEPAGILHVDPDIVEADAGPILGAERGLGWSTAFRFLQDALATAHRRNTDRAPDASGTMVLDLSNDISFIFVKGGTYTPRESEPGGPHNAGAAGNGFDTFLLLPGVRIVGGFAGGETRLGERPLGLTVTTLDGDGLSRHVVTCGSETAQGAIARVEKGAGLYDLRVSNGNAAIATGTGTVDEFGGGMRNFGGAPTLKNVIFNDHRALRGAAVYESEGYALGAAAALPAEALFEACSFDENRVTALRDAGGDISVRCHGGAVESINSGSTFTDCQFRNNVAVDAGSRGGAIRSTSGAARVLTLDRCTFTTNQAHGGGAICVIGGNVLVRDCEFRDNSTDPTNARDAVSNTFDHSQWVTGLTATTTGEFDLVFGPFDVDDDTDDVVATITFRDGEPVTGATFDGAAPTYARPRPTYIEAFEASMAGRTLGTGGAILCLVGHTAVVQCVFDRNEALAGGAIAAYGSSQIDIFSSTFAHNRAIGFASALYAPDAITQGSMRNVIVVGGDPEDPVIEAPADSLAGNEVANNLFLYFDEVGAAETPTAVDFPRWTNLKDFVTQEPVIPPEVYVESLDYDFRNCLFQTGVAGAGAAGAFGITIEDDLKLNNLGLGGARVLDLNSASPAVDAGVDTFDFDPFTQAIDRLLFDRAGRPRLDGPIDIGAYELVR